MSLDELSNRRGRSVWEEFYASSALFLSQVCISDTHNVHGSLPPLPSGDILLRVGDLTQSGTPEEVNAVLDWMSVQPHPNKIFIAGNHDRCLQDPLYQSAIKSNYPNLICLQESSVLLIINGRNIKVYGSPMTSIYGSWAFQYPRVSASQVSSSTIWSSVPPDTDILITHGPPAHHPDCTSGCNALLGLLWKLRPKLHVFGRIHATRGVPTATWTAGQSAYETISARRKGWRDLCIVGAQFVRALVWQSTSPATVLVNAC
ncbi:hypothetical protein BS47DRAFT_417580 [Hydnum rufescens UP504]|uniref:Calcineurin-like phosphoesterase domain-containing protein n=1 Tax=Hydnum rufescens UP504 TaxID=1448309 RepID=A0A9P6B7X0_9AGAM|nr:hypothetical protein BS47DRAFT_417580 [Hydnum rufescens UP504]